MSKEKILSVAKKLFAVNGFTATSIREISMASETNISAINYHFNSKQGLYDACIDKLKEIPNNFATKFFSNLLNKDDIENSLFEFAHEIFNYFVHDPYLYLIYLHEIERGREPSFTNIEKIKSDVTDFFSLLQSRNLVSAEFDPKILSLLYLGLINDAIRNNGSRQASMGKNVLSNDAFRMQYARYISKIFISGIIVNKEEDEDL